MNNKCKKEILMKIKQELKKTDFEDINWPDNEKNIKNFIWVGDSNKLIGTLACHYEFIFHTPDKLSLEVHLDEEGRQGLFKNLILPPYLKFDRWNRVKGRIIFDDKDCILLDDKNITSKSIKLLKKLHSAIGDQLIEIINKNPSDFERSDKPVLKKTSSKIVTKKYYTAKTAQQEKYFNTRHGMLQKILKNRLEKENNYISVNLENGFQNYDYQIDVLAQKKDLQYDIYEVKPYPDSISCIREALGQILHYRYLLLLGGYSVDTLFIVGPSPLSKNGKNYLDSIQGDLKTIKIQYINV